MGLNAATPKIDEPANIRRVLRIARNAALFRSMSRSVLSDLVGRSRHVFYDAGDIIVNQGDDDSCVYLVLAGRVRVFHRQQGPAGDAIAELDPGEIFGELAILETQLRSATVLTIEPTSCLRVYRPSSPL
ncbi:MAG TPA: cyclic nucleotide-binding domain-containing protein [Terriglobia bacterium]|jgi:CRP-like cAMP-binding protein